MRTEKQQPKPFAMFGAFGAPTLTFTVARETWQVFEPAGNAITTQLDGDTRRRGVRFDPLGGPLHRGIRGGVMEPRGQRDRYRRREDHRLGAGP